MRNWGHDRRAAPSADGLRPDRHPASGLPANRAGRHRRPPQPGLRSRPRSPPVPPEPGEPRKPAEPKPRRGRPQRETPAQPPPPSGAPPGEPAATKRRRALTKWPMRRTDDAAAVSADEHPAVACRWESAAFRPHPPRRQRPGPRQQAPDPSSGLVRGPTARGRANPGSGRDRRSSAALVESEEADETAPAPKRDARGSSRHETESGGR